MNPRMMVLLSGMWLPGCLRGVSEPEALGQWYQQQGLSGNCRGSFPW